MTKNKKPVLNMVIGYPLSHTRSPQLHNKIYQTLGLDAIFLTLSHKNIKFLIEVIKVLSIELIAVTMPHKQSVLKYLDYRSPEVKKLNAANTIIQKNNKFYGYNTDVDGIEYALRNVPLAGKNVLIIGAGGAARAALYVMKKNRAHVFLLNRTRKKVIFLSKLFEASVISDVNKLNHINMDIIINATSVGMYPESKVSPLLDYPFTHNHIVFDMVYNPVNTQLLKTAKKRGAKIISGLEMFVGQGLRQIELWLEKRK